MCILTLAVSLAMLATALPADTGAAADTPAVAVGPQYGSTHVYVAPEDFDRFVASFVATFGGMTSKRGVSTVTPTPSSTMLQAVFTPVGILSVFGFETPIPYPFGAERTGYLVSDLNAAIGAARATGANVLVAPFDDPIGRDAIPPRQTTLLLQASRRTECMFPRIKPTPSSATLSRFHTARSSATRPKRPVSRLDRLFLFSSFALVGGLTATSRACESSLTGCDQDTATRPREIAFP
jgi:hypothetical protein